MVVEWLRDILENNLTLNDLDMFRQALGNKSVTLKPKNTNEESKGDAKRPEEDLSAPGKNPRGAWVIYLVLSSSLWIDHLWFRSVWKVSQTNSLLWISESEKVGSMYENISINLQCTWSIAIQYIVCYVRSLVMMR